MARPWPLTSSDSGTKAQWSINVPDQVLFPRGPHWSWPTLSSGPSLPSKYRRFGGGSVHLAPLSGWQGSHPLPQVQPIHNPPTTTAVDSGTGFSQDPEEDINPPDSRGCTGPSPVHIYSSAAAQDMGTWPDTGRICTMSGMTSSQASRTSVRTMGRSRYGA